MSAQFLIGVYVPAESLADSLHRLLAQKSFVVSWSQSPSDFADWVTHNRHRIDCLIVQASSEAFQSLNLFQQRDILLPTLTVGCAEAAENDEAAIAYHSAVTFLDIDNLEGIDEAIRLAVERYLQMPATEAPPDTSLEQNSESGDKRIFLLSLQQQRLSEKLRERLGYVGVYYKRNPRNFLRHLTRSERQEFLDKLSQDYRHIILNYFANDATINQKIDDFVNVAFFADMSVPKIVEIHMELIDDFSKQLQLEGRNEEVLADYRLTLVDVIAHLCEMYRRSLPREI